MTVTRYAVVGDPIAHSKSPQIHHQFATQTGEAVDYEKLQVDKASFDQFVQDFFAAGGGGLNVTLPHKEAAFALAAKPSRRCLLARAANTLWLDENGKLCAENTDGAGIIRDLTVNHGIELADKQILMLGAGGAARGVLATLVESGAAGITVVNRTLSRAEQIKEDFKDAFALEVCDYEHLPSSKFDVIINGTSMSIGGEVPAISAALMSNDCCCYDMMYGNEKTAFQQWADNAGAKKVFDGLGMLVEQAAESFFIWRGIRPKTEEVIAALRE